MDELLDEYPPYHEKSSWDQLLDDYPPYHAKKSWDQWTLDYDEMSDERREDLRQFSAQCREGLERTRNNNRAQWPPDNYADSSDTEDGSRTSTRLLTPDPVVDFLDNTKCYDVSPGLWHDLWGVHHNTRFETRRRSYLFALNDAGQPAVVTVGNDDPTFLFNDPESLCLEKQEKMRQAGLVTFPEDSYLDFVSDYLQGPEISWNTRGAKHLNSESEACSLNRRKLRDVQNLGKGKGHNPQRIEKRGRRPRGKKK